MTDDSAPISIMMAHHIQDCRLNMAGAFASCFKEPCPVCESVHYHADASSVPLRDNENEDKDFIFEAIWFCCMECGTVFETDDLIMVDEYTVTGKLIPCNTSSDLPLIREVQQTVGYSE